MPLGPVPTLGPMPSGTVGPAPELLIPGGTIDGMLPVIAASPSGALGSSPAAEVRALPVTTNDSAETGSALGMSVSTAQTIGLIFLFLALVLAGTRVTPWFRRRSR